MANEDYQITITPLGPWVPGKPNYTVFKFDKLKANSKHVLKWHILWDINTCVLPGFIHSMGSGIIFPTGTKCFSEGDNPMRLNDEGDCSGLFINGPGGATQVCQCKYKITDAGQNKARCE
jgi:hypothetical protein